MLSLDDKLYDILCPDIDGPINSVEQIEAAVAQIKQAFTDAGYLKFPQSIQESKLMDSADVRMTGQEWYNRFMAELGEPQVFVGYGYDSVGYDEDAVLDAARLASGINNKET